jgi:alpha-beta hydrolase superfamily lysophospholipase
MPIVAIACKRQRPAQPTLQLWFALVGGHSGLPARPIWLSPLDEHGKQHANRQPRSAHPSSPRTHGTAGASASWSDDSAARSNCHQHRRPLPQSPALAVWRGLMPWGSPAGGERLNRWHTPSSSARHDATQRANMWQHTAPPSCSFLACGCTPRAGKPGFDNSGNNARGPLLLVSGTADHTVRGVSTRSAFRLYRQSSALTELKQCDGRGHSLTIDRGWQVIASDVLAWLKAKGL